MPNDDAGNECRLSKPTVCPVDAAQDPTERLALAQEEHDLSKFTLGALGIATRVTGPGAFPTVILRQPFDPESLTGIDAHTVRVFCIENKPRSFRPVWDSGIDVALGFVWSRISQPGVYTPIGLPRDRLLYDALRALARERRYRDPKSLEKPLEEQIFGPILEAGEEIEGLRELLTHFEIGTSPDVFRPGEISLGGDGAPLPFPLPGGVSFQALQEQLRSLNISRAGLPEENLFFPPERPDDAEPPWLILPPRPLPYPLPVPYPNEALPVPWPPRDATVLEEQARPDQRLVEQIDPFARSKFPEILCWLRPHNWWMHHRDEAHTGVALASPIRRSNVARLSERRKINLNGSIVSMPAIVDGKIYVGTSTRRDGRIGGILHKIDLSTGDPDVSFFFEGPVSRHSPHAGVGSSPAVTGGKVYFSALTGKAYCLDAKSLGCLWVTDLRHTDIPQCQPVEHGTAAKANGWSSPLVVNNRVYVGCGEGESRTFGFVYCLDASTGKVIWLFCTNQFERGVENKPNVIPESLCPGTPPPPFTKAPNPRHRGASPWSAAAYSEALDCIYIGTGNAQPDDPLPDPRYASGLLSLDATTGEYRGFFQPDAKDSYRPKADMDVDVPAGPMLFSRNGKQYVCFGSKNGSFFILDAANLEKVEARRQLLPYDRDNKPFEAVDPPNDDSPRENKSGVFGTAALDSRLGHIFVGLGGYKLADPKDHAIDHKTTPFIRAMDWVSLADAWPTHNDNPPKYRCAQPPVYCTPDEAGLSSPAVVNDVVFVSTTKPALYAFDAETGLCLWEAPGITPTPGQYALGPAIYGKYVVNGISDGSLYIYSL